MPEPVRPEIDFDVTEASGSSKLARKSRDNPMMALGLAGCVAVVAYGFYKFRNRGKLSTSNYLMQLRVAAQGTVIGCLTIGVIKSLYDYTQKPKSDSS